MLAVSTEKKLEQQQSVLQGQTKEIQKTTMKSFAVLAVCCVGAQAFVPAPKAGPVAAAPSRGASSTALEAKSKALPFLECPETLDGTMIGDFGFDPLGLTENIDLPYGKSKSQRTHMSTAEKERKREKASGGEGGTERDRDRYHRNMCSISNHARACLFPSLSCR